MQGYNCTIITSDECINNGNCKECEYGIIDLNIGDKLKLPSTTSDITTYTVKRGDSLYSIAREYNTTINEIKKLNNLTNNLLSIGQIIKIPV